MSRLIKSKLIRSISQGLDVVVADRQDFTRIITIPQLFVFVLLILVESLVQEEPLSLVVKLAGIAYLLLSSVVLQVIVKSFSLRFLSHHLTYLCAILMALTLLASQDVLYNFYLPLSLIIACSFTMNLRLPELILATAPSLVLASLFSAGFAITVVDASAKVLSGMGLVLGSLVIQLAVGYLQPARQQGNTRYFKSATPPKRPTDTSRLVTTTVEHDTDFWYQVYYTQLFQETLSEVVWRLPVLYLLSHLVIGHFIISLGLHSSTILLAPLTLALFQVFVHSRLLRQSDYHQLLHRVLLLCVACLLCNLTLFIVAPMFDLAFGIFILFQILWMTLLPWSSRFSMMLAALSMLAIGVGCWGHPFWPLMVGISALVVYVGLRLSFANYLSLVMRTALSFLGRYCGIAPATPTMLKMVARLFSAVTGTARVIIIYGTGESEEVRPRDEQNTSVDSLIGRAFLLKLQQFDQLEGIFACGSVDERLRSAVLDWFGKIPRRLFFFISEIVSGDRDEKALIILPVATVSRILGIQRTFMALTTLLGVARISFASARTRFLSSDVMLSYQRNVAEREDELNEIVHLVNNAAQDIAIYCDQARDLLGVESFGNVSKKSLDLLRSIEFCSRGLSLGVSDLKLSKELLSLRNLDHEESISARDLIEDLVAFAEFNVSRRGHNFRAEVSVTEGAAIKVISKEYLETVLRLLLRAAVRRSGGKVGINAREEGNLIVFQISDNGAKSGLIDSAARHSLTQAANDVPHDYIKVASEFARLTGGQFELASAPAGFVNSVILKLSKGELRKASGSLKGHWVLLVDDNEQVTTFYSRVAEALDLKYFTAASLAEAAEILDKQGRPKLVITDIQLSASSGLDLIELIRGKFGSEIPIIVVSGNPEDEIAARLKEYGATKYLMKPVGRRRLFSEIKSIL